MIFDCTPLYVQILEQIEDEICTGKWQEGKRIPSVSELAHQYQVAPQTVSHSLHLLVQRGILKPKRGIGMVICTGSVQRLKQKKWLRFFPWYTALGKRCSYFKSDGRKSLLC